MYKVLIAGGRDFNNYKLLKQKCDEFLANTTDDIVIISGKAKGADNLGENMPMKRVIKLKNIPPNGMI